MNLNPTEQEDGPNKNCTLLCRAKFREIQRFGIVCGIHHPLNNIRVLHYLLLKLRGYPGASCALSTCISTNRTLTYSALYCVDKHQVTFTAPTPVEFVSAICSNELLIDHKTRWWRTAGSHCTAILSKFAIKSSLSTPCGESFEQRAGDKSNPTLISALSLGVAFCLGFKAIHKCSYTTAHLHAGGLDLQQQNSQPQAANANDVRHQVDCYGETQYCVLLYPW